jgi:hypothetical protein
MIRNLDGRSGVSEMWSFDAKRRSRLEDWTQPIESATFDWKRLVQDGPDCILLCTSLLSAQERRHQLSTNVLVYGRKDTKCHLKFSPSPPTKKSTWVLRSALFPVYPKCFMCLATSETDDLYILKLCDMAFQSWLGSEGCTHVSANIMMPRVSAVWCDLGIRSDS